MTQEHLDVDVVAAWADGSLDPHARAAAEAHAADCTRCQAMLAAMVRTEPLGAQPVRGWFAGRRRWAVPLATAAAAATLWFAVSREVVAPGPQQTAQYADRSAARSEPEQAAKSAPSPAAPQPAAAQPGRAVGQTDMPRTRAAPSAKLAEQKAEKPAAVGETVAVDDLRRDALMGRSAAPPPAVPPGAAPPAIAPAPTANRPSARSTSAVATESVQPFAAVATEREIASPDPAVRWRVGPGGSIQRTTDGGRTWEQQTSDVAVDLLAAAAPSRNVCWAVGRSGVVLLSTDGVTWRRVAFPEPIELRAVEATSARTATVTTIDGRVFRTTDGGASWQR